MRDGEWTLIDHWEIRNVWKNHISEKDKKKFNEIINNARTCIADTDFGL